MKKILPIILVFILMIGLFLPMVSGKLPVFPVKGPFLKWDSGVVGYPGDEYTPKAERIPNSEYILFLNGSTLSTIRFWSSNGTIQNKYTDYYSITDPGTYGHLTHVSGIGDATGDIYGVYGSKQYVRTYRVWGTNGTIQKVELDNECIGNTASPYMTREPTFRNLVGNIYAATTYNVGGGSMLGVHTFRIANNTGIISGKIGNITINDWGNPSGWTEIVPGDSNSWIYAYRSNTRSYVWTCSLVYSTGAISGKHENTMKPTDRYLWSYTFYQIFNNPTTKNNLYIIESMDENYDTYAVSMFWNLTSDTVSFVEQMNWGGATNSYAGGGAYLGRGEMVAFASEDATNKGIAGFFNTTDAGDIDNAPYKTWTFGGLNADWSFYPIVNISSPGSATRCWAVHQWDNSDHHNWYTFYRNETADYTISWKTAATWNGTFYNDTLWSGPSWNGTLKNTTSWIISGNWNGTLWNLTRIWRTTFLNERFTLAANNAPSVTDTSWRGQSFTIGKTGENINYYLNHVALNLRKDATSDPALLYTVRVYAADSDHKPTGPVLGTGTINTWRATTSFSWINSTMVNPPLLTAGTKYVIVLFKNTPSAFNIRWGTRNNATTPGSASYIGGYSVTSSNSGTTWSLATGIDCDFMVWGSTLSDWPPIWNGTLYNVTVAWKLGADWNGTLANITLWSIHGDWNGTLFNFSHGYAILVSQWNGTLYNDTLWANIQIWNGTLYNSTYFNLLQLWNGSLWNSTHWMPVIAVWNGTLTSVVHLTLHVHGNGWVSRSPVFIPYSYGDTVNCTATAGMLYLFHDIMGVTATNLYVVTLDKDRVVYANFTTNTSTGYDFTYTDDTDLPKITDVINANTSTDEGVFEWSRVFTYAWVWALGGWFFALVLGVIGGAIFLQYKRIEVVAAYFIIILILFGAVTSSIGYVAGILVALILGFLIYRVLKIKR